MDILIAGGNGFIGFHVASFFEATASIASIDTISSNNHPNSTEIDLTDSLAVDEYASNCQTYDILIFLVGLAHAKGKGKDYQVFKEVNYQTLVNLTSSLDKNGKLPDKIIFSSTISVYGERFHQNIYSEVVETIPFSPYAVTKLEAEKYLLDTYPDKCWILRFAPVYSSTFTLNLDRRSKLRRYFYKVGNGQNKLSMCNLRNIMLSMGGVIDQLVPAGVYNISDPRYYTYTDLLQYQGAKRPIRIPMFLVRVLFLVGLATKNIFLKENSVKLITNNVFPSDKINNFVNLTATIDDI